MYEMEGPGKRKSADTPSSVRVSPKDDRSVAIRTGGEHRRARRRRFRGLRREADGRENVEMGRHLKRLNGSAGEQNTVVFFYLVSLQVLPAFERIWIDEEQSTNIFILLVIF